MLVYIADKAAFLGDVAGNRIEERILEAMDRLPDALPRGRGIRYDANRRTQSANQHRQAAVRWIIHLEAR